MWTRALLEWVAVPRYEDYRCPANIGTTGTSTHGSNFRYANWPLCESVVRSGRKESLGANSASHFGMCRECGSAVSRSVTQWQTWHQLYGDGERSGETSGSIAAAVDSGGLQKWATLATGQYILGQWTQIKSSSNEWNSTRPAAAAWRQRYCSRRRLSAQLTALSLPAETGKATFAGSCTTANGQRHCAAFHFIWPDHGKRSCRLTMAAADRSAVLTSPYMFKKDNISIERCQLTPMYYISGVIEERQSPIEGVQIEWLWTSKDQYYIWLRNHLWESGKSKRWSMSNPSTISISLQVQVMCNCKSVKTSSEQKSGSRGIDFAMQCLHDTICQDNLVQLDNPHVLFPMCTLALWIIS